MAVRITLDKAPVPGEAVKVALLSTPICAVGACALLFLVMLAWALIALLYAPWSPQAVFRAHGLESGPVLKVTALLGAGLGAALAVQILVQGGRWRASHNRRSMYAIAAALRRHRRTGAGWLIHRQRLGLLVLALAGAFLAALFTWGKLVDLWGIGISARPVLGVALLVGFVLLLAMGVRLLATDVPLLRGVGTAVARWLLWWTPFITVVLLFVMAMAWLSVTHPEPGSGRFIGALIIIGLVLGMIMAARIGRRLEVRLQPRLFAASLPRAGEAQAGDRRPPILYLRSFGDDRAAVRRVPEEAKWTRIEDVLAEAARPYGPVIGIGRPDEPPETGFARAYFEGDSWRDAVEAWVDEAQFVLLVAGYTSGVSWELEQVLARGHAAKLIVVFPPGEDGFAPRWDWLQERARRFRVAFLPEKPVAGTLLVCLDRHGEELVMTARKPTVGHYRSALAIALVETFRL